MRKLVAFALIATALFFVGCWFTTPFDGFYPRLANGLNVCDYRFFIQKCLVEDEPYRPVNILPRDACYPPIAYCLVKCFPRTSCGEAFYVAFLFLGLLAGLVFFLWQRERRQLLLCLGAVVVTVPFASGPLRGNPSAWAAGALFVFLAWYDAEVMWKRMVAATALGFATSLKVTPVIYGLLYLRGCPFIPEKWPKVEISVAALSFLVLFAVPFVFFGGPNEVDPWISNALANSRHYGQLADFGLVPVALQLGLVRSPIVLTLVVHLTSALAILFCFAACLTRRIYLSLTLLGVAMVFLCHHEYGLVYLLPAFACWLGEERPAAAQIGGNRWIAIGEAALWFLVFEQAMCVKSVYSVFYCGVVCNWAVIALGLLSFARVAISWSWPGRDFARME